jgi:mannose-1-phosphate guanylyltransferase
MPFPPRKALQPAKSVCSPWTIVLAAGEGRRLCSLTRALHGEDLPKQYARIRSGPSLLQETVSRSAQWSPLSRIVVVVAADREEIAREQLQDLGPVELVVQPRNLGTGPGILLPLARVLARDSDAHVVVLPSDHYVHEEKTFAESIVRAQKTSQTSHSVVLLAAIPDEAETQYGWILPERSASRRTMRVARFHEKPAKLLAQSLLKDGALWNTFIMTGPVRRFWELGERHLPVQTAAFSSYCRLVGTEDESAFLRQIYQDLPAADFSRDVIEKANGLVVESLQSCGWSDWGTPQRVLNSLEGTNDWLDLVKKLEGHVLEEQGSLVSMQA